MYFGAEHFIGFFTLVPSAQWYSNLVTERERGGEREREGGGGGGEGEREREREKGGGRREETGRMMYHNYAQLKSKNRAKDRERRYTM